MGLEARMEQIKKEYEMYKNIKSSFKMNDGKEVTVDQIDNFDKTKPLTHMLERKKILEEILNASKEKSLKDKEAALEQRLHESDDYFKNMSEETKIDTKNHMEKAAEVLARTQEWQNYHMVFSTMDQIMFTIRANEIGNLKKDLEQKKEAFQAKKAGVKGVADGLRIRYPKEDIKNLIHNYEDYQGKVKTIDEELAKIKQERQKNHDDRVVVQRKEENAREARDEARNELNENSKYINGLKQAIANLDEKAPQIEQITKNIENKEKEYENEKQALEELKKRQETLPQEIEKVTEELNDWVQAEGNEVVEAFAQARYNYLEIVEFQKRFETIKKSFKSENFKYGDENVPKEVTDLLNEIKESYYFLDFLDGESTENAQDEAENEAQNEAEKDTEKTKAPSEYTYEEIFEFLDEQLPSEIENYKNTMDEKEAAASEADKAKFYQYINARENLREQLTSEKALIPEKESKLPKMNSEISNIRMDLNNVIIRCFEVDAYNTLFSGYKIPFKGKTTTFREQAVEELKEREAKHPELNQKYLDLDAKHEITAQERKKAFSTETALDGKLIEREKPLKEEKAKYNERLSTLRKPYEELKEAKAALRESYKETFDNIPKLPKVDPTADINKQAQILLDKQSLHASKHTNSKEFNNMMFGLKLMAKYPNIENLVQEMPEKERFKGAYDLEDVTKYVEKQADAYIKAKESQLFHIFPSTLRLTRLALAESVKSFAKDVNEADKKMDLGELESFYENKGKDYREAHNYEQSHKLNNKGTFRMEQDDKNLEDDFGFDI